MPRPGENPSDGTAFSGTLLHVLPIAIGVSRSNAALSYYLRIELSWFGLTIFSIQSFISGLVVHSVWLHFEVTGHMETDEQNVGKC